MGDSQTNRHNSYVKWSMMGQYAKKTSRFEAFGATISQHLLFQNQPIEKINRIHADLGTRLTSLVAIFTCFAVV